MDARFLLAGIASACAWAVCAHAMERKVLDPTGPQPMVIKPNGEAAALYRESHALVISEANYSNGWHKLTETSKEMDDVAEVLRKGGFRVIRLRDPKKAELDAEIQEFLADAGRHKDNRLVVFFSGHAATLQSTGFIVPVDAPLPAVDEPGFRKRALSMGTLTQWAKDQSTPKHAMFIFDACFSGTAFTVKTLQAVPTVNLTTAERVQYYLGKAMRPLRQIISAGGVEEEVPGESEFARQFIAGIQDGKADEDHDGYVTSKELGAWLQKTLPAITKNKQNPQSAAIADPSDFMLGDMVFQVAKPAGQPVVGTKEEEEAALFWQAVQAGSLELYQKYKQRYPTGRDISYVMAAIDKLSPATPPDPKKLLAALLAGEIRYFSLDYSSVKIRFGLALTNPTGDAKQRVARFSDWSAVLPIETRLQLAPGAQVRFCVEAFFRDKSLMSKLPKPVCSPPVAVERLTEPQAVVNVWFNTDRMPSEEDWNSALIFTAVEIPNQKSRSGGGILLRNLRPVAPSPETLYRPTKLPALLQGKAVGFVDPDGPEIVRAARFTLALGRAPDGRDTVATLTDWSLTFRDNEPQLEADGLPFEATWIHRKKSEPDMAFSKLCFRLRFPTRGVETSFACSAKVPVPGNSASDRAAISLQVPGSSELIVGDWAAAELWLGALIPMVGGPEWRFSGGARAIESYQ